MKAFEITKSFDKFLDQYSFYDRKEIYTDYKELVEVSKVREWLEMNVLDEESYKIED